MNSLFENGGVEELVVGGESGAEAGGFVRYADGADVVALGKTEGDFEKAGEHVDVFVAVEVSGLDAGFADFFDLRGPLVFDFVEIDGTGCDFEEERFGTAEELAIVIEDGGHEFGRRGGRAVAEVEVDADAEVGSGFRCGESGVESGAVGEHGGAGDDAVAMGFEDAAVDAFGPGEVVSVDDKVFHGRDSTTTSWSKAAPISPKRAIVSAERNSPTGSLPTVHRVTISR